MFESLVRDLRYGMRLLLRAPLFTCVAVVSIASGLTASLALVTAVNAIVFRPLGVSPPREIHRVFTASRGGTRYGSVSFPDARDFAATGVFDSTCATMPVRANVDIDGRAEMRAGAVVTADCLAMFGVRAHAGRLPGAEPRQPEVVIAHPLWRSRFHASESAVGRQILLNGEAATIVGVTARGFNGTSLDGSVDFWVDARSLPRLLPPHALDDRRHRSFALFTQLRDGVNAAQAEAALAGVAAGLARSEPAAWIDAAGGVRRVTVAPEIDARFASTPGALSAIGAGVFLAVAAVLAIACVNVATLLVARGAARSRELAIRLAVGASRARLLRQLAVESLLIAVLGIAVAAGGVALAIRVIDANYPAGVPAVNLALDWRVAAFCAFAVIATTLLFGLAPAFHVLKLALAEGVKAFRAGTREILIAVQVAASVALLLAAGVFGQALSRGGEASPGFNTGGVAVLYADMSSLDQRKVPALTDAMMRAVAAVPGVRLPAIAAMLPLTGSSIGFSERVDATQSRQLYGNVVSPGYFEVMSIPLRRGRDFSPLDRAGGRPVAIVSETLARSRWQSTDVVGRTLALRDGLVEVVGVAADTRYRAINEPFLPIVYLPLAQVPAEHFYVHARFSGGEALAGLERAARSVDPAILVEGAVPLSVRLDAVRAPERAAQWVGAGSGMAQLALVLMALWALVTYAVERRKREIAVRIALGATGRDVIALVLRPALVLLTIGGLAGSAIGVGAAVALQSEFIGLGELEPASGLPVLGAIGVVSLLALLVPARRAARIEPMAALRAE